MKNRILTIGLITAICLSVVTVGMAFSGTANVVIENVEEFIMGASQESGIVGGTTAGSWNVGGSLSVTGTSALGGEVTMKEASVLDANTLAATAVTLTADLSGTTYYLSGTGTTYTLPAVTEGANFRFVINGASATANWVIDSAEGDNIEGTLIVAGAVVDCDAEDQINFVVDGENIGDYVEVRSDGTQWLIGDSGALTASKLTCTDPS